jgi:nitroreductase
MKTHTTPSGVPVRDLVALATRAPSVHNTQPWHWCIEGNRVILFADSSRQLRYADPDGRDLVISCGGALQHLQVAAAAAGWKAHVRRMPNPYNDAQLANVSFVPEPASPDSVSALDALIKRRTDRRQPSSWPVPRDRLDGLLALGPASGVTGMAVVSDRRRADVLQLLAEAEKTQRLNRHYVDEIVSWAGRQGNEGIPLTSLLRRSSGLPAPDVAPTRFPSGTLADNHIESEPAEPALLVICTSSDDTASRLRAGEALAAMLLKGTAAGLAMVPLSQAIEVDRTRRLLQDELLDDTACPQILVQVGWAPIAAEQIPLTPRRPVDEVLGDVASLAPWMGPYHA